jgi:curved DNA-binding protein CbpA
MKDSLAGGRPRPNCFVQVDLDNAYARLGVSPLAATREIKQLINDKIRQLKSQLGTKSESSFSAAEHEITQFQQIEERIASPKARARYDQEHPQNELLTVQPCPYDHFDDPQYRAGLVTAWLIEALGRDRLLPTAECLAFWRATSDPARAEPGSPAADAPGAGAEPQPAAALHAPEENLAESDSLPVEQLQVLADKAAGPPAPQPGCETA